MKFSYGEWGKWQLHHLWMFKIVHRAWCIIAWELEAIENVYSDGKARMIWKRYAWICRLLQPDKNTKGDKVHWSVHYSLIDFPSQFLSVHWFPLLIEACSSVAWKSLHFPFAHFFCLLGTPAYVRVTSTNLSCLLSTEWYIFAQWAMRFRVGGSAATA